MFFPNHSTGREWITLPSSTGPTAAQPGQRQSFSRGTRHDPSDKSHTGAGHDGPNPLHDLGSLTQVQFWRDGGGWDLSIHFPCTDEDLLAHGARINRPVSCLSLRQSYHGRDMLYAEEFEHWGFPQHSEHFSSVGFCRHRSTGSVRAQLHHQLRLGTPKVSKQSFERNNGVRL